MRKIDLSGRQYGSLTVISYAGKQKSGQSLWLCECSCSDKTRKVIQGGNLQNGNIKSCGCFRREANTTHGMFGTRTYNCWRSMLDRCSKPKKYAYHRYGGRGISVCDRWKESFENFLEDMGECPSNYELDRIDNDGHYTPENCQWASHQEQTNKRSSNHFIEYEGRRLTIAQWSGETGISQGALWHRINHGWSVEKALTQPMKTRRQA